MGGGIPYGVAIACVLLFPGCGINPGENVSINDVAATSEVADYMRSFEGEGEQADGSQPQHPEEALSLFSHPTDLKVELVLAEPDVRQPVFKKFDHRGRLWVVQYNQYPYPAGLKVTAMDNHVRMTFDKVPLPPPAGPKGADKITIFEDTDGDGRFDKSVDAITGLNIVTSVALGRGNIWVLSPPYLLAYPDTDGDGLPDGDPVVHLEGFGLEDTHAVANSLRWGPDGWLYGAQGSTTTANVSSESSKNVYFSGQAIWRYHPKTQVFEIFAEGGGNTFYIEMDSKGRLYSGDNGSSHGIYYKQGGYYSKNWGKHGASTNPYAFGNLPNMARGGGAERFTHAWLKYEGTNLPEQYHDALIAINPLQRYIQLARINPSGSSFKTEDEDRIVETPDRWFRPVDIKMGPDEAIYISDWYDSRLSHVNPNDNWHKSSGRIYRISSTTNPVNTASFDMSRYTGQQLIETLKSGNRWFRQEALRQLGDRGDASLILPLTGLLRNGDDQIALEALWALHLIGGFTDDVAQFALTHRDPYVRLWAIRLLGDAQAVSETMGKALAAISAREPHPEVRSQLASTAKRLPESVALPMLRNLVYFHNDVDDPDIPLLIWWALESKAIASRDQVLSLFGDPGIWERPVVNEVILKRLAQRYAMEGGPEDYKAFGRLLELAPAPDYEYALFEGLQEGLRGATYEGLPPEVTKALESRKLTAEIDVGMAALALRQNDRATLDTALEVIADPNEPLGNRLAYINALGDVVPDRGLSVLIDLLKSRQSTNAIEIATLHALARYDDPSIGRDVLTLYPGHLRAYPDVREVALSLFASREIWALQFLDELGTGGRIDKRDVPLHIIQRFQLMNSPQIKERVQKIWSGARTISSDEKRAQIKRIMAVLESGKGDKMRGAVIFQTRCGACHRLFDKGGDIGPDLTGYDRSDRPGFLLNTVDPNAVIREGYEYHHVQTTEGREFVGKVIAKDGAVYQLKSLSGEVLALHERQIKKMQPQPNSVMPERLLDDLTEQDLKDLFAYIEAAELSR